MFSFLILMFGSQARGQGGGGDQGAGGATQDVQSAADNATQDVAGAADGGGGSNTTGSDGVVSQEPNVEIEISPDIRNQGFVGATAPLIQNGRETDDTSAFRRNAGFIGSASENSGPPLAEGATFGGGVNDVGGSFSGGGGAGGGRAGAFGANEVGFRVTRKSVRAVLRPNFYAPRLAPQEVSNRFSDHLSRQPGSRSMSGNYSINIQNRVAYLSGIVASDYESKRLVRQLRLEPGVSQIVNQLQISN